MQALAHRRIRRFVDAYADLELSRRERSLVGRHLDGCPGCRDELELVHAVKASLERVGRRRPVAVASARLSRFAERLGAGAMP